MGCTNTCINQRAIWMSATTIRVAHCAPPPPPPPPPLLTFRIPTPPPPCSLHLIKQETVAKECSLDHCHNKFVWYSTKGLCDTHRRKPCVFEGCSSRAKVTSIYCFPPRICSRTLMGYSDHHRGGGGGGTRSVFSRGGSLLPSMYADGRSCDDVIAF